MKKRFLVIIAFTLPVALYAQDTTLQTILGYFKNWLNILIPILISIAVIYFMVGVIRFVIAGDDEHREKGKDQIIYGLIGLFVLFSIYGIIKLAGKELNIKQGGSGKELLPKLYENTQ